MIDPSLVKNIISPNINGPFLFRVPVFGLFEILASNPVNSLSDRQY